MRHCRWMMVVAALMCGAASAEGHELQGCRPTIAVAPGQLKSSRLGVLDLLGSVTQLMSPRGRPVLATNLANTVAINNDATPAQRAQALRDSQVTAANAYALADGLGATMTRIYRGAATFTSDDDGKTIRAGQVSPAIGALIHVADATSGGDSAQGKYAFANGHELFGGGTYELPPGGITDVLGHAYGRPFGALGTSGCGDPRPFLMAPIGAAAGPSIKVFDGTDVFGVATRSSSMLEGATTAQAAAGLTGSDLTDSPSFPSGHTTFAYTEALVLAMMVPERYRALVYRASEYGNSRIVLGAHYAVDVIGGRTLATYDLAQDLAGTPGYASPPGGFKAALGAAAGDLRAALRAGGCASIATCADRDPIVRADDAAVLSPTGLAPASPRAAYAFHLNDGLATIGPPDAPPEPVPVEAAALLATRFPYLTRAQRLDILLSTEGPSGRFLDASPVTGQLLIAGPPGPQAEVGAYSRLDLFAAAGGYASFPHQVVVDQDAGSIRDDDLASFADLAEADVWSNDIGGPGGLTKQGHGHLTLTGADTYVGPTIVAGGTLEIAGSIVSAARVGGGGTLAGHGRIGNVTVGSGGTLASAGLQIGGALRMTTGATYDAMLGSPTNVAGEADIAGATLVVTCDPRPAPGTHLTILTARGVRGRFASVAFDPPSVRGRLSYAADAVDLTIEDMAR